MTWLHFAPSQASRFTEGRSLVGEHEYGDRGSTYAGRG